MFLIRLSVCLCVCVSPQFLDQHGGSGVQHIALRTCDIVAAVAYLCDRGMRFVPVPAPYYAMVAADGGAVPYVAERWSQICRLNILVDTHAAAAAEQQQQQQQQPVPTDSVSSHSSSSGSGYLMQTFSVPLQDRQTFFMEVIQRGGGARGFGRGNMTALFRAVEQAQQLSQD